MSAGPDHKTEAKNGNADDALNPHGQRHKCLFLCSAWLAAKLIVVGTSARDEVHIRIAWRIRRVHLLQRSKALTKLDTYVRDSMGPEVVH